MADLISIIKKDVEHITSNQAEYGNALHFISPSGQEVDVVGVYTKHHIEFDPETGKQLNIKNAHCSVAERFFIEQGYPVRNASNEVMMKGHKVRVLDVSGLTWMYVVREYHADETIGLIRMILGDFQ